jgi:putative ABC transport system substrate-binding protein
VVNSFLRCFCSDNGGQRNKLKSLHFLRHQQMERIYTKTGFQVLVFACFFLLSACMKTGHYGDMQESLKVEETQEEIIKPEEDLEAQEAPKIIKRREDQEAIKPKVPPLFLLLSTDESEQNDLTIAAFKEQMAQYLPDAEYMAHLADSKAEFNTSQLVSQKTKSPPALVISLGAPAAEIAQAAFPDTPGLATFISQENTIPHKENRAIVLLQIPMEVKLKWLKRFLPNAHRVGILYDPSLNKDWVEEAANVAQGKNIEIIPFEINSPKELLAGLQYISRNADVLMAIPDQTVYSGKTAKEILLFSYRNRIPFVGLSESWVKAGALYAIDIDYGDMGRQIAGLANKILTDGSSGGKNIFHPEGVTYSLNLRTKDYLRLEIANDIIQGASIVFE